MVTGAPDSETEVTKGDGLAVGDRNRLASSRLTGQHVFDGKYMCISHVANVDEVIEVVAGADHKGGFAFGDACMHGRYQQVVALAKDDRRS